MAVDADLYFRETSDGALTGDENSRILDLGQGGTGIHGCDVWVRVPSMSASDTLDITVEHDDSSTIASVDHTSTFPQITAAGHYRIRVHSRRRYIRLAFNATEVGGGAYSAGAVEAGLTFGSSLVGGARP